MHRGTIEITNKGLGFKLINSMSFVESVIYLENRQEGSIRQNKR